MIGVLIMIFVFGSIIALLLKDIAKQTAKERISLKMIYVQLDAVNHHLFKITEKEKSKDVTFDLKKSVELFEKILREEVD
jgi:hypothetical protein